MTRGNCIISYGVSILQMTKTYQNYKKLPFHLISPQFLSIFFFQSNNWIGWDQRIDRSCNAILMNQSCCKSTPSCNGKINTVDESRFLSKPSYSLPLLSSFTVKELACYSRLVIKSWSLNIAQCGILVLLMNNAVLGLEDFSL